MNESAPRVVPQPRIDTLAQDVPTGESRRRTEYSGSIWLSEPPSVTGPLAMRAANTRTGGIYWKASLPSMPLEASIFIPDSLPYLPDAAATVQIAATLGVQSGGSSGDSPLIVSDYRAVLAPDPRNQAVAWLQLQLMGVAAPGTALAYRIVVLAPLDAVAAGTG